MIGVEQACDFELDVDLAGDGIKVPADLQAHRQSVVKFVTHDGFAVRDFHEPRLVLFNADAAYLLFNNCVWGIVIKQAGFDRLRM